MDEDIGAVLSAGIRKSRQIERVDIWYVAVHLLFEMDGFFVTGTLCQQGMQGWGRHKKLQLMTGGVIRGSRKYVAEIGKYFSENQSPFGEATGGGVFTHDLERLL